MKKFVYALLPLVMFQAGTECSAKKKASKNSVVVDGHEYVDLGLPSGTKWATCNVGANQPTEYGGYFAWGETAPKDVYDWNSYKWSQGFFDVQAKYCTNAEYGTIDGKNCLDAEDDAATANWGKNWRMPTAEEFKELKAGCDWYKTYDYNDSGVGGIIGTSKANGATIFFPAAGYRRGSAVYCTKGSYSSYCTCWTKDAYKNIGSYAIFSEIENYFKMEYGYRFDGRSLRAVVNVKPKEEKNAQAETDDWAWLQNEIPTLNQQGQNGVAYYTYASHPEYLVYPEGGLLCDDCADKPLDRQFAIVGIYDRQHNLVRVARLSHDWFTDGGKKPIEAIRMLPLQRQFYAPGARYNSMTEYAIRNHIGLTNDLEDILKLEQKQKRYIYLKNNPKAQDSLSLEEKGKFKEELAKIEKTNIDQLRKVHFNRMSDQNAKMWVKEQREQLAVDSYQVVNVTRVSNLSFGANLVGSDRSMNVQITFSQKEQGKIGLRYEISLNSLSR